METLRLIEPTVLLEKEYKKMLKEWSASGEILVPFTLQLDSTNFKKMIDELKEFSLGVGVPSTFVPHSTFWLINNTKRILGAVNIRHRLNEKLRLVGGHIGYGIRPSERRKGYATEILKLALIEAKKLSIDNVLITCSKDNVASQKTILKNKGIFNQEISVDGITKLSYWIKT